MEVSYWNKLFSKKFVILFLVLLGLFSLNFFQRELKNTLYKISEPIQKFLWQGGGEIFSFFRAILKSKDLEKELEATQLRNQELLAEITRLKALKEENEFLREALEIGLKEEFELTLANVISKDPFEDSIIIDLGLKEGILKGFPVITSQKVLLGVVEEVYDDFSKVFLISNRAMSFSARVQDRETKGVLKGNENFELIFDLIQREAEIEKGDILVTSVLGSVFPEGLLIGEVKEIEKLDIEPFQRAKVEPFFDLKKIDKVFLIRRP